MNKNRANPSDFQRFLKRFWLHLMDFPYIWITTLFLAVFASVAYLYPDKWDTAELIGGIALILMTILLLSKPMNAIYGLIGATGSIRLFFVNFILITAIFAFIYQLGFFQNAGISYDVNQPHIDYQLYSDNEKKEIIRILEKRDTVYIKHKLDSIVFNETVIHESKDTLHYQSIEFMQVWKSTILTTLTQEPTDLLTIATIHNSAMESNNTTMDKEKSNLFEWILIFHIIISWIFFGVFISLIYSKFRYEA